MASLLRSISCGLRSGLVQNSGEFDKNEKKLNLRNFQLLLFRNFVGDKAIEALGAGGHGRNKT
jgi:hypothetical protein